MKLEISIEATSRKYLLRHHDLRFWWVERKLTQYSRSFNALVRL